MAHDIFLSYSHEDSAMKDRVKKTLDDAGLRVWVDDEIKKGTFQWFKPVENAIETSKAFIILLSPSAKQSDWVQNEIRHAQKFNIRIFSILIRGHENESIPFLITGTQYTDLRDNGQYFSQMGSLIDTIIQYLSAQVPILSNTALGAQIKTPDQPKNVFVEKQREADLSLVNELWKHITSDIVVSVIHLVSDRYLLYDFFESTFLTYRKIRMRPEKSCFDSDLEDAFKDFDRVLEEFLDQLRYEETVEIIGNEKIFVPAYKRPEVLPNVIYSDEIYNRNLKEHYKTLKLGEIVIEQHKLLVTRIRGVLPEFRFPPSDM